VILGIFVLFLFIFSTARMKQYANEVSLLHCTLETIENPLFGHGDLDSAPIVYRPDDDIKIVGWSDERFQKELLRHQKSPPQLIRLDLEMKEPDLKTRFKRKAEGVFESATGVYFKLFNISFEKKPCP